MNLQEANEFREQGAAATYARDLRVSASETPGVHRPCLAARARRELRKLLDASASHLCSLCCVAGAGPYRTGPYESIRGWRRLRHSTVGATGAYTKRPPDSIFMTVIRMGTCT
eukprot:scaffold137823_cov28-Tisochrysis_lutea.AAC.4